MSSAARTTFVVLLGLLCLGAAGAGRAAEVAYDLTIAREEVSIQGKTASGMTINGQIPGPTLRFTEGDRARIRVRNTMDVNTSIHWHGILVPPDMDGVPFITQVPIAPGTTYTYEFPLRQSGTYWYHSHSNLQEQSGLYGAIAIAPKGEREQVDRDEVVLLSDWTTDQPHAVLRTLKRGSEWFALQKGSAQSVLGAAKARRVGDYFTRELQRMPPMDIADVAYDYFLANGRPEITIPAEPGQTLRLRIIDGSATTYFHLDFAGGPMTLISADGQDVVPHDIQRFLIGVAETYDVLVTVPGPGLYELRATAHDGSGHASVWIGSGMRHPARPVPKPNLYDTMHHGGLRSLFSLTPAGAMRMPDDMVNRGMFDEPGMGGMPGMEHGKGHSNAPHTGHETDHQPVSMEKAPNEGRPAMEMEGAMSGHTVHDHTAETPMGTPMRHPMAHSPNVSAEPGSARSYGARFGFLEADIASRGKLAEEGGDLRPWAPYDHLRATRPTAFPKDRPVREVRLTLDGDMERYVWFLNNKPLSETDHILIKGGEVVRFIMINRTMMHHPMHLHGHFFRVINAQGDYAPLKHTVDVAPMSTRVIEFYTDEVGDWFFHCHLLYHMMSGMARLVHYQGFSPAADVVAVRDRLYKDHWYAWGEADVMSNMTEGALTLATTRIELRGSWEAGWQEVEDTEWEGIVTLGRHANRFTSFFAGVDALGEGTDEEETRGVIGLSYLLPLNLETRAWLDTGGGARVFLEKELELTPRIGLHGEIEYDTHEKWEGAGTLHYMLNSRFSLMGTWHSEYGFGAGIRIRF